MKFMLASAVGWLALGWATECRSALPKPVVIYSQSGQFAVSSQPSAGLSPSFTATGAVDVLHLDPALLVVSCEGIKQALLRELAMPDRWRGSIHIQLQPAKPVEPPTRVISVFLRDSWTYRVEIPAQVDRRRFLKAILEVLLREIAHRGAGPRQAEFPPWLVEGMLERLEAATLAELVLDPGKPGVQRQARPELLKAVREQLKREPPLTLDELNWPTEKHVSGGLSATYRACAHLLVAELLRLKGGRQCLVEMLTLLPQHLNWQTAFLRAFGGYFPALIDFDKWWGLTVVSFTGQDQFSLWPGPTALSRLEEIVTVPVQVRLHPDQLPATTRAKLQSVLAEWDYARQRPLLLEKINHLDALRWRAPADCGALIDQYRQALHEYVSRHDAAANQPPALASFLNHSSLILQETVQRLNRLDAQRIVLAQGFSSAQPPSVARSP